MTGRAIILKEDEGTRIQRIVIKSDHSPFDSDEKRGIDRTDADKRATGEGVRSREESSYGLKGGQRVERKQKNVLAFEDERNL